MSQPDQGFVAAKQPQVQAITLNAAGAGSAIFQHDLANIRWIISQVSVDAGGVCTVQAKINGLPCTSLVTGSSPLTADGDPPVSIGGHDTFTVFVTAGPTSGNVVCTAWIIEVPE